MKTTGGDTALHWACSPEEKGLNGGHGGGDIQERSSRVAELLLAAGADVGAKNDKGETPLDIASGDEARALVSSVLKAHQEEEERKQRQEEEREERQENQDQVREQTVRDEADAEMMCLS